MGFSRREYMTQSVCKPRGQKPLLGELVEARSPLAATARVPAPVTMDT